MGLSNSGAAINFTGAASSTLLIDNSTLSDNYASNGQGGALAFLGNRPRSRFAIPSFRRMQPQVHRVAL